MGGFSDRQKYGCKHSFHCKQADNDSVVHHLFAEKSLQRGWGGIRV